MSSTERCDEILRLIDETLAEMADRAPRVASTTGGGPATRPLRVGRPFWHAPNERR